MEKIKMVEHFIILNNDSFTLSVVGLTSSFLGVFNFNPLAFPDITQAAHSLLLKAIYIQPRLSLIMQSRQLLKVFH